ncbi:filamentous hemagglutinin outer membrane protein [Nostoc sp. NIES-4103]|nr:filamentous hemagglutinin outer membrane protein [Nostoc sp. NIES-4103]
MQGLRRSLFLITFPLVTLGCLASLDTAKGQIIPDNSLGAEKSVVNSNANTDQIDGGARRGANLFHSFQEFNVGKEGKAYFSNPAGIENILSRVTGENPSNIFGTLGVLGNANLFFINPNGVFFGPDAKLDIKNSFLASTATSLNFADGTKFSVNTPETTPLLTMSIPVGLQFRELRGKILVQGSGHHLSYADTGSTIRPDSLGLQVPSGKTLALVGGDIALEGGNLTAKSGRIELGSVDSPSFVTLNQNDSGFALGYSGVQNFGNIELSQKALADVSGEGGGEIQVQGGRLMLHDGSAILSVTQGSKSGGNFTVNTSKSVELIGESPNRQYASSLSTETQGTGSTGDMKINTGKLIATNGAYIQNSSFGRGNGGNLAVQASENVDITGKGLYQSGLYTEANSTGNAGNLTITTGKLLVRDGAKVTSSTSGQGNGGNLIIKTEDLSVENDVRMSSDTFGQGDAGNLTIYTKQLNVQNSQVSATTFDKGNAGNLTVHASESVDLNGEIPGNEKGFPGGLFAQVDLKGTGHGGNLTINTRHLSISDGSKVQVATFGAGDAGNILIRASVVDVFETSRDNHFSTGIFAGLEVDPRTVTPPKGNGGNLTIETERLSIDGASITSRNLGVGIGGNIKLQVPQLILLRRGSQISTTAGTDRGPGKGGNMNINTDFLVALPNEDSNITADSFGGRGGAINITAKRVFGLEVRKHRTSKSDITAISQLSPTLNGEITLEVPTVDPAKNIVEFPVSVIDPAALISQNPCTRGVGSKFIITGRGGLPPSPNEATSGDGVRVDLVEPVPGGSGGAGVQRSRGAGEKIESTVTKPIVPAQGWIFNKNGEVILTAYDPTGTGSQRPVNSDVCPMP